MRSSAEASMYPVKSVGAVFDIQRFSLHDGPGIRTAVFLKGCPMRCPWCQNPESWEMKPQLLFNENRCLRCGKCKETCPLGAPEVKENRIVFPRIHCGCCGEFVCVRTCNGGALRVAGRWMDPGEVMEEAKKDLPFFRNSGGGITLTGGEPFFQPEFAGEILKRSAGEGIHTTVETCGLATRKTFKKLLPLTDLVLYDLKSLDPDKHYRITGCRNTAIIRNARDLIRSGRPVCFRIPLVPAYTLSESNLTLIGTFLRREGFKGPVELIPYHGLGVNKYGQLGIRFPGKNAVRPTAEQVEGARILLQRLGLEVCQGMI